MRTFEDAPARRTALPLLIGLTGASGSGKTYSALRLATGIQRVSGGEIHVIDTENGRATHYAPDGDALSKGQFSFRHVRFDEPFGPLDYLEALRHCKGRGASVIVVDSMSHEHEGPGGILEMHDKIVQSRSGGDYKKAMAISFTCWAEPKAQERRLMNSLGQLGCHVILCFRAKEKVRPPNESEKRNGQKDLVQLGWQPIASSEFVYELGVNALLLPGSEGVPTWKCDTAAERIYKRPEWSLEILRDGVQLSEDVGERLAKWAAGKSSVDPTFDAMILSISESDAPGLEVLASQMKLAVEAGAMDQSRVRVARRAWAARKRELEASPSIREPGQEG